MKYAFPSGFQGSQLSGYLPNNKLSVSCVYHRKLLLAKNLYGNHRPPPGVCPALLAASERVPELRVPQPPPLFTRVSLSLVHKPGSPGAKVPLEQISRRATVWEENHINQKAWLCVTGQESPCWDICKLRKKSVSHLVCGSCSHIPHLKCPRLTEEPMGSCRADPHCVCQEREWHPEGDEVCQ